MEQGLRGAFPERPPFLLLGFLFTAFYWVALGPAIGGHPVPLTSAALGKPGTGGGVGFALLGFYINTKHQTLYTKHC